MGAIISIVCTKRPVFNADKAYGKEIKYEQ